MSDIRKIAAVRDLAAEFQAQADRGDLVAAVVMVVRQDDSLSVAWSAEVGQQRVNLVGLLEFLKRDLMATTTPVEIGGSDGD